jgi:hypothetical protein
VSPEILPKLGAGTGGLWVGHCGDLEGGVYLAAQVQGVQHQAPGDHGGKSNLINIFYRYELKFNVTLLS